MVMSAWWDWELSG